MKSKFSIKRKLIALIVGISFGVLTVTGLMFYWAEERAQELNILTDLNVLTEIFAANAAPILRASDVTGGNKLLSSLRADPAIKRATIYRRDNTTLSDYLINLPTSATTGQAANAHNSEKMYSVTKPVVDGNERIGLVTIYSTLSGIHLRMNDFVEIIMAIFSVALIISFALASKFQAVISRPLLYLARIIRQVSVTRNYSIRADLQSQDETGDLMAGFNQMLSEIEQRDRRLQAAHDELELHVADRTQKLVLEIAERERVEQALRREEAQMRLLIRTAPIAIAMLDMTLHFVEYSDTWLSEFGDGDQDLHERSLDQKFPDLSSSFRSVCSRALKGEYMKLDEDSMTIGQGDRCFLNWTVQPWFRPDGAQGGIIVVAANVSELVSSRENALKTAQIKSQFLANLSHEVRTPLNAIIGFADLVIHSSSLEPSVRGSVETIESSARLLLSLINDVLDFSKIDSKKMDLESIEISLIKILNQTVEMLSASATAKGIKLRSEIDPAIPAQVIGDSTRLMQVLINLVGNAIKFTDDGEVCICAKVVRSSSSDIAVRFEVNDTGIGIPLEVQDKIFDAFTQADGSTTRRYGGTGLGLAIASRLVELMGGKISIASSIGQGSQFSFKLSFPLAPSAHSSSNATLATSTTQTVSTGQRILVVEDNLVNQKLIGTILRKSGYQVEIAENGADALKKVAEERFALVFMDIQMPVMGGLEATRSIRAEENGVNRLPIIALTAHAFPEDRELCFEAGVDEYLTKPIDRSKLLETIKRFVS